MSEEEYETFTAQNVALFDQGEIPPWLPPDERTDAAAKEAGAYEVFTKVLNPTLQFSCSESFPVPGGLHGAR